jgi:hypothetical protein
MIWYQTGNKWLDTVVSKCMSINSELDSCACINSPLKAEEVQKIQKAMKTCNKVFEAVYKRELKKRKQK